MFCTMEDTHIVIRIGASKFVISYIINIKSGFKLFDLTASQLHEITLKMFAQNVILLTFSDISYFAGIFRQNCYFYFGIVDTQNVFHRFSMCTLFSNTSKEFTSSAGTAYCCRVYCHVPKADGRLRTHQNCFMIDLYNQMIMLNAF